MGATIMADRIRVKIMGEVQSLDKILGKNYRLNILEDQDFNSPLHHDARIKILEIGGQIIKIYHFRGAFQTDIYDYHAIDYDTLKNYKKEKNKLKEMRNFSFLSSKSNYKYYNTLSIKNVKAVSNIFKELDEMVFSTKDILFYKHKGLLIAATIHYTRNKWTTYAFFTPKGYNYKANPNNALVNFGTRGGKERYFLDTTEKCIEKITKEEFIYELGIKESEVTYYNLFPTWRKESDIKGKEE